MGLVVEIEFGVDGVIVEAGLRRTRLDLDSTAGRQGLHLGGGRESVRVRAAFFGRGGRGSFVVIGGSGYFVVGGGRGGGVVSVLCGVVLWR